MRLIIKLQQVDKEDVRKIISILDQMTRCRFFSLLLLAALVMSANAAKGVGPRGAGRNRSGRRMYGPLTIPMPHRNSASARYYENKDVSSILAYMKREREREKKKE